MKARCLYRKMKRSFYSILPGRVQQKVNNLEEIVVYNEQFSLVSLVAEFLLSVQSRKTSLIHVKALQYSKDSKPLLDQQETALQKIELVSRLSISFSWSYLQLGDIAEDHSLNNSLIVPSFPTIKYIHDTVTVAPGGKLVSPAVWIWTTPCLGLLLDEESDER